MSTSLRSKFGHATTIAVAGLLLIVGSAAVGLSAPAFAQEKKPNIVMLMTDDTGWGDFGAYAGGGKALGHPDPQH